MATAVPNLSIVRSGQVPNDPVSMLAGPQAALSATCGGSRTS